MALEKLKAAVDRRGISAYSKCHPRYLEQDTEHACPAVRQSSVGDILLVGLLSILISAQASFGFNFMIKIVLESGRFLNYCSFAQGLIPPLVSPLPGIDLDAFKICSYKR